MPRRKTSKAKPKRRARRMQMTKLPLNGFPSTKVARLRYCEEVNIDTSSIAIGKEQFRANSLFDPNYTKTGHQPRGFDQWMLQYNHAYVVGAKMTARFTPTTVSNEIPAAYGIMLNDNASEIGNYTQLIDILESKAAGSQARNYRVGGQIYENNSKGLTVSRTFSAKKQFGPNVVGNSQLSNTATAGPSEVSMFDLWVAPIGSTNPGPVHFIVTIDYLVVFKEPNFLATS